MAKKPTAATMALAKFTLQYHVGDAAKILDEYAAGLIARFLEEVPIHQANDVIKRLTPETASDVLAIMDDEFVRQVLTSLDPNRVAPLLSRLDANTQENRLASLDKRLADELRSLIAYPRNCAGGLMDPRVTAFRPDTTVREVVQRLRDLRRKKISDVFLIDDDGRLLGMVALQEIVLAKPGEILSDLATMSPPSVRATSPRDAVLEILEKHRVASLAVVDFDGKLLGVLRHQELMTAATQEASVDMQTMFGASKEERALSSPWFAIRKRLPWLEVNLVTAFIAAAVVGLFEDTIAKITALAVLLPVVAGQSGNTGAQALAVTMRGLALREVRMRHWLRVAGKEVTVGALNGIAVAATTGVAVFLWSKSFALAAVIASSMVLSMIAAALAGALIPMGLTAIRQDPAQSSSIILTTVTDVVGFLSFLGIATLFASHLPT